MTDCDEVVTCECGNVLLKRHGVAVAFRSTQPPLGYMDTLKFIGICDNPRCRKPWTWIYNPVEVLTKSQEVATV